MKASVIRFCKTLARVCGVLAATTGCFGLLGWVLDVEALKAVFTGGVTIKANAAVCLMLLGTALLLLLPEHAESRWPLAAGRIMASVAMVVGGLTVVEHLSGKDFGIDQLMFHEPPGAAATASPGRMGPPASASFFLSGLALLLLDVRTRRGAVPAQWLALLVGVIVLLPLIGYAYSIQSLFGIAKYTGIALHTAMAIATLAVGLLAARPTAGLMVRVSADDAGGEMARCLLIPAILIPFVLGWLRTVGERAGLFDVAFGRPILILSLIVSFTTLVWWNAGALSLLGRDRKRAEEELRRSERESEQRLAAILDNAPAMIYVVDAENRFRFINGRWQLVFGITNEQVAGRSVYDFFAKSVADEFVANNRRVLESRAPVEAEEVVPHADGPHTYISVKVPLLDAAGEPYAVCGISTDITERREAERERERLLLSERAARAQAERASEAKNEFLATLSHELRTPLTPVLLTVSLMESHPDLPADLREDVGTIRRNIELESRLISDLLDLTRIEKGKLELDERDVDLHLIVRSAIDICQRETSAKMVVDLGARLHTVRGDSTRLQQVFWNLINNAIKFTPGHGMITVRSRDAGDGRIHVELTDTGAGIDSTMLPRLFNAFEQGEVRAARQQAGLGLGLAISKKLAEAHGGTITATSEGRGHGSTFTVDLPVLRQYVGAEAVAVVQQHPSVMPTAAQSLSVLLVEDHEPTLRVMERLLRQIGHRVTGVTSVASASAAAQQDRFDVIICDLGLPDGSGLDVMRQLRDRYTGRAIALTGYGMESDIAASRDAGFAEHLTKPVDLAALDAAICRVSRSAASGKCGKAS